MNNEDIQHEGTGVARTQQAINDAALRVFTRDGKQANMATIAEEAGVGRATLYRYARSRQDLVDALSQHALTKMRDRLHAANVEEGSAEQALGRAVRAVLQISTEFAFLQDESHHFDRDQLKQLIIPILERFIERGREEGILRTDMPIEWQRRMLAVTCRTAVLQLDPLEDRAAIVLDTYLAGCGAAS